MQIFTPATANKVTVDMVAKASGDAITAGTVAVYLIADTGDNAGKWWDASGSSWSATEASAGSAAYKAGSAWEVSVAAGAWDAGVRYKVYGEESGDLHIPYTDIITEDEDATGTGSTVVSDSYGGGDYTYKTSGGAGISGAEVWAYLKTDYDAGNTGAAYVQGQTTTDATGGWNDDLHLASGTYTLYYFKQGAYGPDTVDVTVT